MIKAENVTKSFGKFKALDGMNLHAEKGSVYGLIGPNGAGKTTFIKTLMGIYRPDCGKITVDGKSVYENVDIKQRLIYICDDLFYYPTYSILETAKYYAGLYPEWSWDDFNKLREIFKIDVKRKVRRLSKGMQKQAAFTLAISAMPDALILDEPVDGLDPIVRRTVWDIIVNDVAEREMTVLISSHNLKEIEGICDTVGILSAGELVLERELDDLKSNIHKVQVAFAKPQPDVYSALNILSRNTSGSVDMLIVRNSAEEIEDALNPYSPLILDMLPLTLEEIFIYELGGEKNEYSSILL